MTQFNLDLDQFLRASFWTLHDLGVCHAIIAGTTVYILWVVIESLGYETHQRLWAYILSVTLLGDAAALFWTWGMDWEWTAIIALAPLCVLIYLAPTAIATYTEHPSCNSIFVVNLITGWTLIGWTLALMWAQRSPWRTVQYNIDARLRASRQPAVSMDEPGKKAPPRVEIAPCLRCAIYTYEGFERAQQDFKPFHAQRKICEAFIERRAAEGWRMVKAGFDDGGLLNSKKERPALRKLLSNVAQNLVDIVIVDTVGRLTRSAADFSKMVELLDSHHVALVAVAEQLNTATSMGRLTLNLLRYFNGVKREGEGLPVHHNIAGPRKKERLGGHPPLGYDLTSQGLAVNPAEAETVREIYRLYEKLGSVRRVKEHLDAHGVYLKGRVSKEGVKSGWRPFSRGALHAVLSNPIYIGEIQKGSIGISPRSETILDQSMWMRTQEQLRNRASKAPMRLVGSSSGSICDRWIERDRPDVTLLAERLLPNGR